GGSWRSFSEYGRRLESPCTQLRPGRPLASTQCSGPGSSSTANGLSGQRRLATGVLPLEVASTGRLAGREDENPTAAPLGCGSERKNEWEGRITIVSIGLHANIAFCCGRCFFRVVARRRLGIEIDVGVDPSPFVRCARARRMPLFTCLTFLAAKGLPFLSERP